MLVLIRLLIGKPLDFKDSSRDLPRVSSRSEL